MMPTEDKHPAVWLWLSLLLLLSPPAVRAASFTFTGTGDWNDTNRWAASTLPANGDTVTIDGAVTLSNSTAILASYTLNASRTNMFLGTNTILYATNVTIYGTVTHSNNLATTTNAAGVWEASNIVYIVAYSNVSVETTGKINADGKGFKGGTSANGYGPGGGVQNGQRAGGGGYGGAGASSGTAYGGGTYGVSNAPVDPGSGGGGRSIDSATGGHGGGAVRIAAAEQVLVNGLISAGGTASGSCSGGGSGGAVYIECGTYQGSGLICATGGLGGGVSGGGAGGAGGRIAVVYTNTAAQNGLPRPSVAFNAAGGYGSDASGLPGTLYLPDAVAFPSEILTGTYQMMIPGFTNWAPNSLTITNGTPMFPPGIQISVTNSVLVNTNGGLWLTNFASFTAGGNLVVTNGSRAYFYSAMTNGVSPDYGSLVSVSGDVVIANGSHIYPFSNPTNGGSVAFVVSNLTVLAGGHFCTDGRGYRGGYGSDGYGPGKGGVGGERAGGGGYGGSGAPGSAAGAGGTTYGSAAAPVQAGSGGAGRTSGTPDTGGNGGGSIRVEATGRITVDGRISADGNSNTYLSGGGSGGGIYLVCGTFDGSGWLSATGGIGEPSSASAGGGGGGGRIAVVYTNTAAQSKTVAARFTTAGGKGYGVWGNTLFPGHDVLPQGDLGGRLLIDHSRLHELDAEHSHGEQWHRSVPGWFPALRYERGEHRLFRRDLPHQLRHADLRRKPGDQQQCSIHRQGSFDGDRGRQPLHHERERPLRVRGADQRHADELRGCCVCGGQYPRGDKLRDLPVFSRHERRLRLFPGGEPDRGRRGQDRCRPEGLYLSSRPEWLRTGRRSLGRWWTRRGRRRPWWRRRGRGEWRRRDIVRLVQRARGRRQRRRWTSGRRRRPRWIRRRRGTDLHFGQADDRWHDLGQRRTRAQ